MNTRVWRLLPYPAVLQARAYYLGDTPERVRLYYELLELDSMDVQVILPVARQAFCLGATRFMANPETCQIFANDPMFTAMLEVLTLWPMHRPGLVHHLYLTGLVAAILAQDASRRGELLQREIGSLDERFRRIASVLCCEWASATDAQRLPSG